jgi:hypothetical protein
MLMIGSLSGGPCSDCGRMIKKRDFGTSDGTQDFCRACSDKKFGNDPAKTTPKRKLRIGDVI